MSEEVKVVDDKQEIDVKPVVQDKEPKVIVIDDENKDPEVDYKKLYSDLLLDASLKESKAFQALDLPEEIALEYFKKYFTVKENKGKVSITAKYDDADLVDKEGKAVSVDAALKHIIANSKELRSKALKQTPGYKGSLSIATVDLKNMSVSEKLAYRKQVGPSIYRDMLAKQQR